MKHLYKEDNSQYYIVLGLKSLLDSNIELDRYFQWFHQLDLEKMLPNYISNLHNSFQLVLTFDNLGNMIPGHKELLMKSLLGSNTLLYIDHLLEQL